MPCYDSRGREEYSNSKTISELNDAKRENKVLRSNQGFLEAGLCAIINELQKRGLANEIIPEASRNGLIDLMQFWYTHNTEDIVRLSTELHKFSKHEQSILKDLLNKS